MGLHPHKAPDTPDEGPGETAGKFRDGGPAATPPSGSYAYLGGVS